MHEPSTARAPTVESEVLRIRGLIAAGQHAEALPAALALAGRVPENRDALYMLAHCQRLGHQPDAALATLARLEAAHPGFSRLYQERGIILASVGQLRPAIDSLLEAVQRNPWLRTSWSMLEKLFASAGRHADAAAAGARTVALGRVAPAVVAGAGLLADGEADVAGQVLRDHLATHPDDAEALRVLAGVAIAVEALDDAGRLLEAALARDPASSAARYDLVRLLIRRHENARARVEAEQLLAVNPTNLDYLTAYATACAHSGDEATARDTYQRILDAAPTATGVRLSLAHVQKTLGDEAAAVQNYRLAADQGEASAWWGLADLKTYRFSAAELERLAALESLPTLDAAARCHLSFALGTALEAHGRAGEAFAALSRGNALRKAQTHYRPEAVEEPMRRQMALFTTDFLRVRAGFGDPDNAPIFIVGLPRSGSTLVEQILAAHPAVEATAELPTVPQMVRQLEQGGVPAGGYPGVLATLNADDCRRLGGQYLEAARPYRTGKAHFIDKMPNNFRHLGLIRLILPNARIIDVRRDPMACCFSNFKQLFAAGQEFTYSLEDLGRYYRAYVRLMDHWDTVLPGWILRVRYEDVVDDLEGSVRRLLGFCGLPFDSACLDFQSQVRRVRTASAAQVRRPVTREGLDQWRQFEPWLGPLREALADIH